MTRNDLMQRIDQLGLAHRAEELERLIKPAIRITTYPIDEDDLSLGASKFGGRPDLPPHLEWPAWNKRPLNIIAQLNLREIAASVPLRVDAGKLSLWDVTAKPVELDVLPSSGILYFFYDATEQPWGYKTEHHDGWRVLYSESESSLLRSDLPSAFSEDDAFPACRLAFAREAALPDMNPPYSEQIDLSRDEEETYWELTRSADTSRDTRHRLLGHPQIIQNPMEAECAVLSHGFGSEDSDGQAYRKEAKEWRPLLQVDSDDNAEMMWGDGGRLYFWVKEADLQARRFDNVWLCLQCH